MKIALIGYGKMGKEIEKVARSRGHEIVCIIDINNQDDFESEAFKSADVAIEFTNPMVAYSNYMKAFKAGVKLVSGSTGWMAEHGEEIKKLCTEGGQTLFWSSNFSLGVSIFSALNKYLAKIMNQFPAYDVTMSETHHIHKLDAPSGTAITLAEGILEKIDRKDKWVKGTFLARHRACEDRLRRSRPWSRSSFLVLWRYMGEDEMSYPFFAYMSRLKYIARWGLMRSTIPENDAEHTLQTAMIAHALALIRQDIFHEWADPEHCAMLALYHDASEVFTGDLPTPVKYFTPGLHEKYEEIETEARKKLLATLPEELQESYASYLVTLEQDPLWPLAKAADTLSAFLKCAEEVRDGNPEFQEAYRTTRKKLEDLHMKEVDWFLTRFAKSFEKTLDQLNQNQ